MKKISLLFVAILLAITGGFAQTPMQFKYQAVLRDASGTIIANEAKTVIIDILQGSASGTSVFNETHNVTTTAQGLININVGSVNSMNSIDWSADTYFIKITVGTTVMGTSQLLSVPYAMTAKNVENVDYADISNTPTIPTDVSNLTDNTNLFFDRNYNSLSNLPTLFDGQWSSLSGTAPNVSTFTNDANYLTSFTELDPTFTTNFDLTSASNGDLLKFNGTKFIKFTPNYLTSYTETQNLDNVLTVSNDAGAKKITNLADPTDEQDAATKAYVDLLENKITALENTMNAGGKATDYDGNTYNTVKIGNQIWMAENLKVTHYPNGNPITNITDNTDWGHLWDDNYNDAYCFYDNDENNNMGALYTYSAAIADGWAKDNNPNQGVCPDGWHLPTDAEWQTLEIEMGMSSYDANDGGYRGTNQASKLAGNASLWDDGDLDNNSYFGSSGFIILPGGYRYASYSNGYFLGINDSAKLWTASEETATDTWYRRFENSSTQIIRGVCNKSEGISVRCVKD